MSFSTFWRTETKRKVIRIAILFYVNITPLEVVGYLGESHQGGVDSGSCIQGFLQAHDAPQRPSGQWHPSSVATLRKWLNLVLNGGKP